MEDLKHYPVVRKLDGDDIVHVDHVQHCLVVRNTENNDVVHVHNVSRDSAESRAKYIFGACSKTLYISSSTRANHVASNLTLIYFL